MRRWAFLLLALLSLGLVACASATRTNETTLALDYRSVTLLIGMPADEAIAALGEDYTLLESESCAGEGVDRMYTYPSARLYVFAPCEGEAVVSAVSYTDDRDGAATKDVRLGCAAEDVRATFGEPTELGDTRMIYRRGGAVLRVTLREGVVTAIALEQE
jgi:hypothetical protein